VFLLITTNGTGIGILSFTGTDLSASNFRQLEDPRYEIRSSEGCYILSGTHLD
jgi:hypothetical protein